MKPLLASSLSFQILLSPLVELWKQATTLMVVTHDQAIARRADRVIETRDRRAGEVQRSA